MARIRHLAIVTDNRERLVKFYTTAFGMKVIDGVGPAIYLSDGYLNLAIIQKRGNYKEGLYHFGFEVENIEELRPLCKELGRQRISKNARPIVKQSIASTIRTGRPSISHNTGGRSKRFDAATVGCLAIGAMNRSGRGAHHAPKILIVNRAPEPTRFLLPHVYRDEPR